jgi:glycosyltransferase involved in cell wall biosynthesis
MPALDQNYGDTTCKGVKLHRLPSTPLRIIHEDFRISLSYGKRVNQQLRAFRPDIIHLQDSAPVSRYLLKQAHRLKIPVLATHHPGKEVSAPYFSSSNPILKHIIDWFAWRWLISFLNQPDLIVVPSHASVEMLIQQGLKTSVRPISCGVDAHLFSPDPTCDPAELRAAYRLPIDKPIFLYVGRIDTEKCIDVLIRAMSLTTNSNIYLAIAGKGCSLTQMKSLANSLGVSDRVRFLGEVDHDLLPALMGCADIFTMPGDAESLSIATIEAMSCGKPVLAARAMALTELITHRKNGLLFEPKSPKDAAQKMDLLAAHPEWWEAYGQAGRLKADQHNLSATIDHYVKLFLEMRQKTAAYGLVYGAPGRAAWFLKRTVRVLIMVIFLLFATGMLRQSSIAPVQASRVDDLRALTGEALVDDILEHISDLDVHFDMDLDETLNLD